MSTDQNHTDITPNRGASPYGINRRNRRKKYRPLIKNNRKTTRGRKRQVIQLKNGKTKVIIHNNKY